MSEQPNADQAVSRRTAMKAAGATLGLAAFARALAPLAEKYCLTKAEVAAGIEYAAIPEEARGCPGMNPVNQLEAA